MSTTSTPTKFGIWRGWRTKRFYAGPVEEARPGSNYWMARGDEQPLEVTEEIVGLIGETTWPLLCRLIHEHPAAARDLLTPEFVDKALAVGIVPAEILEAFDSYKLEKEAAA